MIGSVVPLLISCITLKDYSYLGRTYEGKSHGTSAKIAFLNDSIFLLQAQGGAIYSRGYWRKTDDGKMILLNSFWKEAKKVWKGDTALYLSLSNERVLVERDGNLIYKGLKLTESKK